MIRAHGPSRRVLLVTGAPRTGTTAVGRMLALGRGVCTLHEPFNRHVGLRRVRHYFEVPGAAGFTREDVVSAVRDIRALQLRFRRGTFPADRGLWRAFKLLFGGRAPNSYRLCRLTPGVHTIVWKDPFASFFAGILATDLGVDVVITVRNPWAVAASFKRMAWAFDLAALANRLDEARVDWGPVGGLDAVDTSDPVANAAVLWRMVYGALERTAGSDRLRFVDLESVVVDPVGTYRDLYMNLDLSWTPSIGRRVGRAYGGSSELRQPRPRVAHDQRRDLRAVNRYWDQVLTGEETQLVSTIDGERWELMRQACR